MGSRLRHREATQNRLTAYLHPLRAAIFTILTQRTASPAEMTRELGLERKELPNVNHHTKRLVDLGCAEKVGERIAGSTVEKLYKATERALIEADEWDELLENDPALADHFLGEFMQCQLDDYTAALGAGVVGDDGLFHVTRTRRVLDRQGLEEGLEVYDDCRQQMDEVERRSAERRSETGEDAVPVSACLSLFKLPRDPP